MGLAALDVLANVYTKTLVLSHSYKVLKAHLTPFAFLSGRRVSCLQCPKKKAHLGHYSQNVNYGNQEECK
jgi:hypothetical protein